MVQDAGINFIGPSPEAMRIMGSKLAAKACVKQYNIPMVPGIDEAVEDISLAKSIAGKNWLSYFNKSFRRRWW
jgi:propionyl-CoA carboxylase alpha chain